MEECYHECSAAMEGLTSSTVWGAQWCHNERAVLRKLVGCKDSGDTLFRKGDYLAAVSSYGAGISLFGQSESGKVREEPRRKERSNKSMITFLRIIRRLLI